VEPSGFFMHTLGVLGDSFGFFSRVSFAAKLAILKKRSCQVLKG
jgi:hypothetical protein